MYLRELLKNIGNHARNNAVWGIGKNLSLLMIYICTGVFILTFILDLLHIISRHQIYSLFGISFYGLFHKVWLYQFVTAPLLHANITHLAFNMLNLLMFGRDIELKIGRTNYIVLSVLAALFGSLAFVFVDWGGTNIALGYSAIIYGLLTAQALLFPGATIFVFGFFRMKVKYAVLLLGAIEIYLCLTSAGGTANVAHVFGALGAFIYLKAPFLRGYAVGQSKGKNRPMKRLSAKKAKIPDKI